MINAFLYIYISFWKNVGEEASRWIMQLPTYCPSKGKPTSPAIKIPSSPASEKSSLYFFRLVFSSFLFVSLSLSLQKNASPKLRRCVFQFYSLYFPRSPISFSNYLRHSSALFPFLSFSISFLLLFDFVEMNLG